MRPGPAAPPVIPPLSRDWESEGCLRVTDLHAGYGDVRILRDVFLVAPAGEVVAVLGPNGAGKSTLLRSIVGLADVIAGTITLGDTDLGALPTHLVAARGVCFIPEGRAIYRTLTVVENLELFAGAASGAHAGLDRVFDVFPVLKERRRQVAGTLSGGQQQMVALSRSLIRPYQVLLIDELSMGLAPVIIDELFEILSRLRGEGLAMVIVEQHVQRALELADLAFVLNSGEVVFAGEAQELADSVQLSALYLGAG